MVYYPGRENPDKPLPSRKFVAQNFGNDDFVWLGHSTVLFKTSDLVVLADPAFNRASPVPGIANPFPLQHRFEIDDLPKIDIVVISHDHYDHLDDRAIKKIALQGSHFLVPLGIKAHLMRWGVAETHITELDWYQFQEYQSIRFTLAPSRHFSGRKFDNQNSTLWGSWVIRSNTLNIYFSGDSGYSKTFAELGQDYGPFDIAFVENGAYNLDWASIHMFPEEAVQAGIDLKAERLFPIHWGKFDLALHPWDEPAIRFTAEASKRGVRVVTPMIGEIFDLKSAPNLNWWDGLRN